MNLILEKNNPSLEGKCHHFHGNNILQQTMPFILATCPSCHLLCKALARIAIIIELERGLDVMEGKKIDCFIFINRMQENCEALLWPKMKQRGENAERWLQVAGMCLHICSVLQQGRGEAVDGQVGDSERKAKRQRSPQLNRSDCRQRIQAAGAQESAGKGGWALPAVCLPGITPLPGWKWSLGRCWSIKMSGFQLLASSPRGS